MLERIKNVDRLRNVPERIVPGDVERQSLAEHSARYKWAAPRLRGRILDLGCGVGYGGQILLSANGAIREVVGLDMSPDALEFARQTYANEELRFVQGDACCLPFADNSFDAVVSFEAIEHVKEPVALLKEVRRVLKPRGTFLVSTPNKYLTSPLTPWPLNPHHEREWYPQDFVSLVQQHFTVAGLYGQNWFSKTVLFQVFSRDLRTVLKVGLDRLGIFDPVRRIYRRLLPYHAAPVRNVSAEALLPGFVPQPFAQRPGLLPGVVIVETVSS